MGKSTGLLKSVFEADIQPMLVVDSNDIVTQYNASAQKLFQFKAKEVIGKNIKKLLPDICDEQEIEAKKKDGSSFYVSISASEVAIVGKEFYTIIIHDVSESRKLREQNQRLVNFNLSMTKEIENSKDYKSLITNILSNFSKLFSFELGHFYEYKINNNRLESSGIFFCNKSKKYSAFVDITKKTPFKKGIGLPGMAWKKQRVVYYPDILKSKNFPLAQKTKKPLNLIGGLAFPVNYNEDFLGVIEFYSDKVLSFTEEELKLFENLSKTISIYCGLYHESRNLKLMFDSCEEGFCGVDISGNITFVNPSACDMLGYTSEELIGELMHDKIHYQYPGGKAYPAENCQIYNSIHSNRTFHVQDEVFLTKSHKEVPVAYTVTPIIENKKVVGGVIIFVDISDKIEMEKHIACISKFQERYIQGEDKQVLFADLLKYLLAYTNSEFGFIGAVLSDETGNEYLNTYVTMDVSSNAKIEKFYKKKSANEVEFRNLGTLFCYTIKTGEAVISNDPQNDKRFSGVPEAHPTIKTYLGIPVFGVNGALVATYGVANCPAGYGEKIVAELRLFTNALSGILESSRHYDVIEEMGKFDTLTKVYNRQYFDETLKKIISTHAKQQQPFTLMMIDINKFKNINDVHGHHIGDELLGLFSKRISGLLKKDDFFARIGGDEFIVILKNVRTEEICKHIAHRIIDASKKPYRINEKEILCEVSIGIASYPLAGNTPKDLLRHVDFSLYSAKKTPGKLNIYSKMLAQEFNEMIILEEDLKNAFKNEEFYLNYQPQVEMSSKKIIGFEVLLRWKPKNKPEVSPGLFIPVLEKMGESELLNEYMIHHALTDLAILTPDVPIKVAINISPKINNLQKHIKRIINIVKSKRSILNENVELEFELTESSFMATDANPKESLYSLFSVAKKTGVTFAIDDFGVEYSSINRLIQYPFDTVKIDQVFIQKLDSKSSKSAIAVIKTIITLSEDLGFIVIAEGVETKDQMNHLLGLGCKYAQGFYFYKPIKINKLKDLIG